MFTKPTYKKTKKQIGNIRDKIKRKWGKGMEREKERERERERDGCRVWGHVYQHVCLRLA